MTAVEVEVDGAEVEVEGALEVEGCSLGLRGKG